MFFNRQLEESEILTLYNDSYALDIGIDSTFNKNAQFNSKVSFNSIINAPIKIPYNNNSQIQLGGTIQRYDMYSVEDANKEFVIKDDTNKSS